jgi:hypothetical protein
MYFIEQNTNKSVYNSGANRGRALLDATLKPMHATIKHVVKEECIGKVWITTIEFEDGGEVMRATGVGKGYQVGDPIIAYIDDRYGRCKFSRTPNSATMKPYGKHTGATNEHSKLREPHTELN